MKEILKESRWDQVEKIEQRKQNIRGENDLLKEPLRSSKLAGNKHEEQEWAKEQESDNWLLINSVGLLQHPELCPQDKT